MRYPPVRAIRLAVPLLALAATFAYGQAPASVANKAQYKLNLQKQFEIVAREKATRTPGMRKLDQVLIYTVRQAKGENPAKGLPKLRLPSIVRADGTVEVEISAAVTSNLLLQL
ncbi:hypothetical protein EON79_11950, partial [bacterium]